MSPKATPRSYALRYYLWADEQAYRIPHRLHSEMLDGKVRLLRFAGTAQRIIQAAIVQRGAGRPPRIELGCTTYLFDEDGFFDLGDQANALQGIAGMRQTGNILDIQDVLAVRRWASAHQWAAPQIAIEQVFADIRCDKNSETSKPLPVLRVDT